MSTRLLPGEKPRNKKDIGTTSYKRPGPPTPSKNGGRLSLQGSELREEHNGETKTPKRVTPGRIKALFMGRSLKENNSEVSCNCTSASFVPETNFVSESIYDTESKTS